VFDGGTVTPEQVAGLTLQRDELTSIRFATLDEIASHVRPSALRRLQASVEILEAGAPTPAYLQFGRPALMG